MSFYRTYRPQTINEIDNAKVRETLRSYLGKNRAALPHAFFFTGPKGAGKTTAARLIAKIFNCEKPGKNGPCGECRQCISISKGTNMDVIEMDAASNRGIDEIRQLRERIGLTPVAAGYTVYIIDEVHMLTTEAFNALLKTLEEPPVHAVFVLATTDPHKVPATILSRCQPISFAKAGHDEVLHALERILKSEKIDIERPALDRIIALSDGSFRDAVKLLEQVSFREGTITAERVNELLSVPAGERVSSFAGQVFADAPSVAGVLASIEELSRDGIDFRQFITDLMNYLHTVLVEKAMGTLPAGHALSGAGMADVSRFMQLLVRAYGDMRVTPVASLPLELAVIEHLESRGNTRIPGPDDRKPAPADSSGQHKTTTDAHNITHQKDVSTPKAKPPSHSGQSEEPHAATGDSSPPVHSDSALQGLITLEKLTDHWADFIAALKPNNHSIAGVLRSTRPKQAAGGIVTIEAFYKFHQEKLNEPKTREILAQTLKKLFGEKVKVEVILGKK